MRVKAIKVSGRLLNFNSHALTFILINSVKEMDGKMQLLTAENEIQAKQTEQLKILVCADHPTVPACR